MALRLVLDLAVLTWTFIQTWVIFEQNRLQQLRLAGLEAMATHYLQGATRLALEGVLAAASIDPLRESAQLILLQYHTQGGNYVSDWHAFHEFLAQ